MTVGMTVELQTSSFCMKPRVNKDESKKKEDEKAVRADTAQQENSTDQGDTESLEDLEDTESADDESCESSGEFLDIQQVQDEIQ